MIAIEKLLFLQRVELLSALPVAELGDLASRALEVPVAQGTVILHEGEEGDRLYVVVEGNVRISRSGTEIAELDPGAYFGEIGILADVPATATATATTDTLLLAITREDFHSMLADNFSSVLAVIRNIVLRMGELAAPRPATLATASLGTRQTPRDTA